MVTSRISYSLLHCDLGHPREHMAVPVHEFSQLRVDRSHENVRDIPSLYVAVATWIPKCNMYNTSTEDIENTPQIPQEPSLQVPEEKVEEVVAEQSQEVAEVQDLTPENVKEAVCETPAEAAPSKQTDGTPKKVSEISTPMKALTPKQLQRKLESDKKKSLKQQEKEEREKKRQEEKDERERKKREVRDELEKQKLKEKEERQKQKDEKDEQKRLEREAKLKEKEMKQKEKEEKDELKRKEKEEKEEQKRKELEEKERKKQIEEKSAKAFTKFFVLKKSSDAPSIVEEKKEEAATMFMPFSVKPDMRLAPVIRRELLDAEKDTLTKYLQEPTDNTYLNDLKNGKITKRKSDKTWPVEDDNEDVMMVEDDGAIIAQERKIERIRAKMLKFHENKRPAYFGTWRKKSKVVKATKPFALDKDHFDYEVDSDDDWEEEVQGESLEASDDEEKEPEAENDYEEDNDFFVPHGYLSEGEGDDEDNVPMSPESHKAKLKLLKSTFDEEINSKTERLKPRLIGCVWEDVTKLAKVQDAFHTFLQSRAMITNGTVQIKKRDLAPSTKKTLSERKAHRQQLNKDLIPTFLQLVHGNVKNQMFIVNEFLNYMNGKNLPVDISKSGLGHQLKALATWMKCPEEGPLFNKHCWYVNEEVRKLYNADVSIPNKWSYASS